MYTLIAPNQYAPEQCQFDTAPEYTFGARTAIEPPSITPAPNAYAPEKVNLETAPAFTMRPKTAVERPNLVPAPNQYAPEKVNLDLGPSFTMRPKTAIDKPNNVPGRACISLSINIKKLASRWIFNTNTSMVMASSNTSINRFDA